MCVYVYIYLAGIFYCIGAEFRGFHLRFADVARGGIRMVKSASPQAYAANLDGLFNECYSLASTQQRKNKDIPEGGSKGVILLNLAHQDKGRVCIRRKVTSQNISVYTCHVCVNRLHLLSM